MVEAGISAERRGDAGASGRWPQRGLALSFSQRRDPLSPAGSVPTPPVRRAVTPRLRRTDSRRAWGPGAFTTRSIPLAASKRTPGPARLGAFCSHLQGGGEWHKTKKQNKNPTQHKNQKPTLLCNLPQSGWECFSFHRGFYPTGQRPISSSQTFFSSSYPLQTG